MQVVQGVKWTNKLGNILKITSKVHKFLVQQSEETISEENLATQVGSAPGIQSYVDKDDINEKPNTSSLANLESKSGKDNTAVSVGIVTAGTPVSYTKDVSFDLPHVSQQVSQTVAMSSHQEESSSSSMADGKEPAVSLPSSIYVSCFRNKPMDYDDSDFQNQNLHLAGEANSKFPHLKFDSLVRTEVFLGIEGNEDSRWIENFSRGSSGIVFGSAANESSAMSRHNNVWSEATSLEFVEMLLNSVGQDEVIVRENSIKKSDTSDVEGCTMEQMEPSQTFHEKSVYKEETENLQPNPPMDDTPGESSVLNKT